MGLESRPCPLCLETQRPRAGIGWEVRQAHIQPSTVPHPAFQGGWRRQVWLGDPCQVPTVKAVFHVTDPWPGCGAYIPSQIPQAKCPGPGLGGSVRLWEHEVIPPFLLRGSRTDRVALCGGQAEWYVAGPTVCTVLGCLIQLCPRSKGHWGPGAAQPLPGALFPFLEAAKLTKEVS